MSTRKKPAPIPTKAERDAALLSVFQWLAGVEEEFRRMAICLRSDYSDLPKLLDPEVRKRLGMYLDIFIGTFDHSRPDMPTISAQDVFKRYAPIYARSKKGGAKK